MTTAASWSSYPWSFCCLFPHVPSASSITFGLLLWWHTLQPSNPASACQKSQRVHKSQGFRTIPKKCAVFSKSEVGCCLSRTAALQAQADYPLSMHWISRFDRMWMGVESYLKFHFMVIHTAHFLVSFCWNKTKNKFHFPNSEITHSSQYLSEILLRNVFMVSAGPLICAAVPPMKPLWAGY